MAKIYIERAYIEPIAKEESHEILIHIKEGDNHVFAGKVELTSNAQWLYTKSADNGDLEINYSTGMEARVMNYILEEIIDGC
jgi:hypothetical protein